MAIFSVVGIKQVGEWKYARIKWGLQHASNLPMEFIVRLPAKLDKQMDRLWLLQRRKFYQLGDEDIPDILAGKYDSPAV